MDAEKIRNDITEAKKALMALYVAVHEDVAKDVEKSIQPLITLAEAYLSAAAVMPEKKDISHIKMCHDDVDIQPCVYSFGDNEDGQCAMASNTGCSSYHEAIDTEAENINDIIDLCTLSHARAMQEKQGQIDKLKAEAKAQHRANEIYSNADGTGIVQKQLEEIIRVKARLAKIEAVTEEDVLKVLCEIGCGESRLIDKCDKCDKEAAAVHALYGGAK